MKRLVIGLILVILIITSSVGGIVGEIEAESKLGLLYAIVVANSSLKSTVQDFVKFKESQGFDVIVEDVPTIEKNYQGIDRVEQIRNFLKDKTKDYPKSFTLLIGAPYDKNQANSISTGGDIPIRIITPQNNDTSVQYPTDFYYADLDGNWDSNNDKKYGTEKDEIKEQVHNFVGRIPFSAGAVVKTILANTIDLWHNELKSKSLLAMSKMEGSNYDYAIIGEKVRLNTFESVGFSVNTLYEKEGTNPSTYSCTASLNEENFNKYLCGNDIIITYGHGGVFREVWYDNNKNEIVDPNEIEKPEFFSLNDLNTSQCKTKIWFDFGCVNAFKSWEVYFDTTQEPWFVTADAILEKGIAAVVIGSTYESPMYDSDIETACNTIITSHLSVGEWLYNKVYPRGIKYYELAFNILGDPSFSLFDDSLQICADVIPPSIQITSPSNGSFSNDAEITITGTVFDVGSGIKKVEINTNSVTFTDNSFTALVKLEEVKNIITITAIDKAGNETTTNLNIIRDIEAPAILIGFPNDNSTVATETISVSGSAIDENIDTVKVNGKIVSVETNGFFDTTIKLQEGKNVITIIAIDKAGNSDSQTVTVYYKKPQLSTVIILQISNPYMTVNGVSQEIDPGRGTKPVIKNSRTLVPIRAIVEALGGSIGWDGKQRKVTIMFANKTIELWIGKSMAKVNGIDTLIDPNNPKVVPLIINERTMLPLRFIAESLGCKVDWEAGSQTITITYPGGG